MPRSSADFPGATGWRCCLRSAGSAGCGLLLFFLAPLEHIEFDEYEGEQPEQETEQEIEQEPQEDQE